MAGLNSVIAELKKEEERRKVSENKEKRKRDLEQKKNKEKEEKRRRKGPSVIGLGHNERTFRLETELSPLFRKKFH